jgi:hypothetical protein
MQIRTLALAAVGLALAGTGVAVAAGGDEPRGTAFGLRTGGGDELRGTAFGLRAARGDERRDDLARRIGVTRAKLDAALRDMALAEVDWARGAGFLTEAEANRIKERIRNGGRGGPAFFGHGFGFGLHGGLEAAAEFLGLTADELHDALATKTLAQIAADEGKSLDGLKAALRDAAEERLNDSRLTARQREAVLARLDAQLDDLVNGRSPQVTELARRLGVDRAKVVAALRDEAIAKVDRALDEGHITQEQANEMKERIRSAPGDGVGGKLGPGIGFGFGMGKPGVAPGGPCGPDADGERRRRFRGPDRPEAPGRPGFMPDGGELELQPA